MADTFAHGVRRRPQALQSPRPIAQACSVRSEGMTGLEVGRLPTAHRASGPSPRLSVGAFRGALRRGDDPTLVPG